MATAQYNIVRPETVVEKSFIESVSGIINEVVPSVSSSAHHMECRDTVTWAHFEHISGTRQCTTAGDTLVLLLGYASGGMQAWLLEGACAGGVASHLFSWRAHTVTHARIVPTRWRDIAADQHDDSCEEEGEGDEKEKEKDVYWESRPLLCLAETITDSQTAATGATASACTKPCSRLVVLSLRSGQQLKIIQFKSLLVGMCVSERYVVAAFTGKLVVFSALTWQDKFSLNTCFVAENFTHNPIALGHRWLVYADKRLNAHIQSYGGVNGENSTGYLASVFHAAKSISKGIRVISGNLASRLVGARASTAVSGQMTSPAAAPLSTPSTPSTAAVTQYLPVDGARDACAGTQQAGGVGRPEGEQQPGVVTVVDLVRACRGDRTGDRCALSSDGHTRAIVAHFQAHYGPIVCFCLDSSGTLLVVADTFGHSFNVFSIQPHILHSSHSTVQHLYTLYRGDTTAKILDMTFSDDSRWISVATHRGTIHMFAVCPYGGPVCVSTHCSARVVNRLGVVHVTPVASHENTATLAPSSVSGVSQQPLAALHPPALLTPLAQLRQPYIWQITSAAAACTGTSSALTADSSTSTLPLSALVSAFASPRAWLGSAAVSSAASLSAQTPGGSTATSAVSASGGLRRARDSKRVQALFVMTSCDRLFEYHFMPVPTDTSKEKVSQDGSIELTVHAHAQWNLSRVNTNWLDTPLPLSFNASLIGSVFPDSTRPSTSEDSPPHDSWVSKVEISSHLEPHRRIWMGPQFSLCPQISQSQADTSETTEQFTSSDISSSSAYPTSIHAYNTDFIPLLISESVQYDGHLQQQLADAMQERNSCNPVFDSQSCDPTFKECLANVPAVNDELSSTDTSETDSFHTSDRFSNKQIVSPSSEFLETSQSKLSNDNECVKASRVSVQNELITVGWGDDILCPDLSDLSLTQSQSSPRLDIDKDSELTTPPSSRKNRRKRK